MLLCLFERSVYVDNHQGRHVRQSELDGQERPLSTRVGSEYCNIPMNALMDEEHGVRVMFTERYPVRNLNSCSPTRAGSFAVNLVWFWHPVTFAAHPSKTRMGCIMLLGMKVVTGSITPKIQG